MKKIQTIFKNLGKNIIVFLIFMVIFLNFNLDDISKVITGIVAICGLIIAYSYNNGAKNQREQQLLQIKKESYIKFVEAFLNKKIYFTKNTIIPQKKDDCFELPKEVIEINEIYCKEVCKLNIYAPDYILEFISCFNDFEVIDVMVFEKYGIDVWRTDNKGARIGSLIKNTEEKTSSKIEKSEIEMRLYNLRLKFLESKNLINALNNNLILNTYISNIKDDNLCSTYYASMNEILSDKVLLDLIRQDLNNLRSNNLIDVIVYPNFINIDGKIKYIK